MTRKSNNDQVKIRIELLRTAHGGPCGEWVWAEPVEAHDGGGTYRLFNISHFVPLGLMDVVRAELDGDGLLQVVDVVEVADAVWTRFAFAPWLTRLEVRKLGDSWVERGSQWSEGNDSVLTTMWPGMSAVQVRRALDSDLRSGRGALLDVVPPDRRSAPHQKGVDLRLGGRTFEPTDTTYWVGDDPWWAAHGFTEPDFLALIQTVAGEEMAVACALEAGRHQEALRLLHLLFAEE